MPDWPLTILQVNGDHNFTVFLNHTRSNSGGTTFYMNSGKKFLGLSNAQAQHIGRLYQQAANPEEALKALIHTEVAGDGLVLDPSAALLTGFGLLHPPMPAENAQTPYGAATFSATDFSKLRDSLLEQMRSHGIPLPDIYEPFPNKQISRAHTDTESALTIVEGTEKHSNKIFSAIRQDLNVIFPDRASCRSFKPDVLDLPGSDVFTGIHESTHYVFHEMKVDGVSIMESLLRDINKTGGKSTHDFKAEQMKLIPEGYDLSYTRLLAKAIEGKIPMKALETIVQHDKHFDALHVAKGLSTEIDERVADAGTALYILSNYGDTRASRKFILNWSDTRRAHYWDHDHDTSSSIEAAVHTFDVLSLDPHSASRLKGLSIAQTTLWATDIIKAQPEFNRDIHAIANDLRQKEERTREMSAISKRLKTHANLADLKLGYELPPFDAVAARDRLCVLAPASP